MKRWITGESNKLKLLSNKKIACSFYSKIKRMRYWRFLLIFIIILGCKDNFTPKPRGFFRINFPEKNYQTLSNDFPYNFEIPSYSVIEKDNRNPDESDWINISVPENKAQIHISYYSLTDSPKNSRERLIEFMEETRKLAYKHSIKADAINEQIFINNSARVFGTIYKIHGNAASPVQFFLTDSTEHFLRGALYIKEVPDIDSLKPVIDFLEPDVIHLIETTHWK